jgi:hypothetical protein
MRLLRRAWQFMLNRMRSVLDRESSSRPATRPVDHADLKVLMEMARDSDAVDRLNHNR